MNTLSQPMQILEQPTTKADLTYIADIKTYYQDFINFLDATPKTKETYTRSIRIFIKWLSANGITQPTREDIINFRDEIKATHQATTTRAYINAVKQFFKWLSYNGFYKDITINVKGAKITREHKKDYLTINQAKELLASFKRDTTESKRDYAIICLCLCCGLRTIEIVRADIKDMRPKGDFMALYVMGKGRQDKTDFVKIPLNVEKAIRDYLKARNEADTNAPLFASCSCRNNGERLTTRSISGLIKEAFRSIGLDSPYLTAHSLRHTTANLNLRNGGSLEETQQLLRHADISTTMIYIKEIDRAENKSEERLANLFFA